MRNKRFLIGALGLAISMLFASSAFAITNVTQTVDGVLGGKEKPKFDKKKFKKTSVKVTTTTADADNPSGMPPKANTAIITFDKKDVKFDSKAVPGCDPNAIENTTTDAALAACGNSEVGTGHGSAALPFGVGGTRQDFDANVAAFNRSDAKGILLHSRVDALGTTVVLKGTLNGTVLTRRHPAARRRRWCDLRVRHPRQGREVRPGPVQGQEDQLHGRVPVQRRADGRRARTSRSASKRRRRSSHQ